MSVMFASLLMGSLRILVGGAGLFLVYVALRSALITFVLPRSAPETISRLWFRLLRRLFVWRCRWAKDYMARNRIMALYAPVALLCLLPI